jgi:hypothetical protein
MWNIGRRGGALLKNKKEKSGARSVLQTGNYYRS